MLPSSLSSTWNLGNSAKLWTQGYSGHICETSTEPGGCLCTTGNCAETQEILRSVFPRYKRWSDNMMCPVHSPVLHRRSTPPAEPVQHLPGSAWGCLEFIDFHTLFGKEIIQLASGWQCDFQNRVYIYIYFFCLTIFFTWQLGRKPMISVIKRLTHVVQFMFTAKETTLWLFNIAMVKMAGL